VSVRKALVTALKVELSQELQLPLEAIYLGDRPQRVTRQGLEVWLEPQGREGGASGVYRFGLHLRYRALREADLAGEAVGEVLWAASEQLRERLDGARPFAAVVPALVACGLEEGELSEFEGALDLELSLEAVIHD
tara:strand:- start:1197 stop:1604 length:408 start_codon:yes stop_codon:yes gene_type:complete